MNKKYIIILSVSMTALAIGQALCWMATDSVPLMVVLLSLQCVADVIGLVILVLLVRRSKRHQAGRPQESIEAPLSAEEWIDQSLVDSPSLSVFLERARAITSSPEAIDTIKAEISASHQALAWVIQMNETFYPRWRKVFEETPFPVDASAYAGMRSVMNEVALHCMDYVRYRTGDINVTTRHLINPAALLLRRSWEDLHVKPISFDPMAVPRDVRVIADLLLHDGVKLEDATIMGYRLDND